MKFRTALLAAILVVHAAPAISETIESDAVDFELPGKLEFKPGPNGVLVTSDSGLQVWIRVATIIRPGMSPQQEAAELQSVQEFIEPMLGSPYREYVIPRVKIRLENGVEYNEAIYRLKGQTGQMALFVLVGHNTVVFALPTLETSTSDSMIETVRVMLKTSTWK